MSKHHKRCERCKSQYMSDLPKPGGEGQGRCPTLLCVALDSWDDERWAGASRMAQARRDAGITLNDTDTEALRRARRKVAA